MKFLSMIALWLAFPIAVCAQAFPAKPIRVIVPFPPGGVDVTMRLLQNGMQAELGQPLVLENRAGANGYIGSEIVAHAPPDGYTLLATSIALAAGPQVVKAPFDPVKDFTAITQIFGAVGLIIVKPSLPINSTKELIDYAKRNPGKLSYASTGIGSAQHIDMETLKLLAGIDVLHVPYKGGGPQTQAIISGEVDMTLIPLQTIRPHLGTDKVKVIAVYDGRRYPGLPNIPDVTETLPEFSQYKAAAWIGIFGPAGLPRPVLNRLNAAAAKAINSPEVRGRLAQDSVPSANSPEEFAEVVRTTVEKIGRQVKALTAVGVKLE
jgi:tripartite-type tricarboxylate transporter receptor subunit TctC